jgi:hypothetical protein
MVFTALKIATVAQMLRAITMRAVRVKPQFLLNILKA